LPISFLVSHDDAVAGPRKLIESSKVFDEACAQWIQMDVSDQFSQVKVFLAQYGLIPILKQVPVSMVFEIKGNSIACEEAAHDGGSGD
jgi:hypothetical protein